MDINSIPATVSKIITPDMYPMIGLPLIVVVALIVLRAVVRMLVRVAILAGLVMLAFFFLSGSTGAVGPVTTTGVESFLNQVAKNLPDFGKMVQGALPASTGAAASQTSVDPTPYMDVQNTYQNIVGQLKGVQATASGK